MKSRAIRPFEQVLGIWGLAPQRRNSAFGSPFHGTAVLGLTWSLLSVAAWAAETAAPTVPPQKPADATSVACPKPTDSIGVASPKPANPTPLRERLQKRINVDFRKMAMEDVIRIIAEQADVGVVASPNVKGEVTVKLTNVPLEEALRSILEVYGFDYVVGDNIIKVLAHNEMPQAPPAPPEKLATQIFEITYTDVNDVVKSLEKFKSDVGSVTHIRGTSRILVTDKESKVKDISDFISQVDHLTPQILVEARIYDITSKDNLDLGVQWSAGSRTGFDATTGKADPATQTNPFLGGAFNGTTAKASSTDAGFRFGWLTSNLDIDVLLKAQNEKIEAKLLANPRVLVLNDQTATMKIVSQIPYQQLTESALGGSIGTTAFRDVGVELNVTAHLAARDQMIKMHLKPVFSVVTGQVQVAGINVTYPQPIVDRRETDTTLFAKNGQTIVLGGLRKKEVNKQVNKIPGLGDLPLLGALFRFDGEQTVNSELIVFVTPWIVAQPALSEKENQAYEETEFEGPQPTHTGAETSPD